MNLLLTITIILFSGLLFGRLAKLVKLPNVTGYLFAGLVMGPYVLNILNKETVESVSQVSQMALAFIAFTIGLSFKTSYFKKVGATPVIIAIFEAMVAVFLVQGVLIAAGFDIAFSLVLGAIAAATAPAATIMVIRQYKAKGPVTDTLMSVVAIDDAIALIAFGFAVAIAQSINGLGGNLALTIAQPFFQVFSSLLIGAAVGIVMKIPLYFFKKSGNRLVILIASVFLASAAATLASCSELLSCMMCGAVFCNISKDSDSLNDLADFLTPPLFMAFFVVSGAQLDVTIIPQLGIVGLIYIVVRVVGKIGGAYIGARLSKAPREVRRFLGPTLLPQAGVAIGLTIVARTVVPDYADSIRAVILCGTLIYELIGPAITKLSLIKAGEIETKK